MTHVSFDDASTPVKAAVTTATSVVSVVVSHAGVNEFIQAIAGVVAICSGCMAITYYYYGILERIRNKK